MATEFSGISISNDQPLLQQLADGVIDAEVTMHWSRAVVISSGAQLTVGAIREFTISWPPEMPDADYCVNVSVEGGDSILGAVVAIIVPGSLTTAGCNIRVKNIGLSLLGADTFNLHISCHKGL